MRLFKFLFTLLCVGAILSPALADDLDGIYRVKNELVVSGTVDQVLTGENMVRLKTVYGADVEVPLRTLGGYTMTQMGEDNLTPGDKVRARINPGLVSLAPAQNGKVWVTVDGKQFLRMYAKDFNDDLFDDDDNVAVLPDGREQDVSMSRILENEAVRLEVVNW